MTTVKLAPARLIQSFCFCLAVAMAFLITPDASAKTAVPDASSPEENASEKMIAVVETRPFSKEGHGELSLGVGSIASDIFLVYVPVTLRGAYHFKEWVALELSASYMGCFSQETGENQARASGQACMRFFTPTYDHLTDTKNDTQLRSVKIQEYQVARFSLDPVFSLFEGKFALANQAIAHFDLNLALGIGLQILEMPAEKIGAPIDYRVSFEGNFGFGVRFIFLDFLGLRMDFREFLFGKQRNKGLGTASEFSLSVSFLL